MIHWLSATVAIQYRDDDGNTKTIMVTRFSKWLTIIGVMIIGASMIQTVIQAGTLWGVW